MGHDKEYELNRASVDAVSEELVGWMQKSGISKENAIRIRLTMEELLLRIIEHYDEPVTGVLAMRNRFGTPKMRFRYKGESFDPIHEEESEEDEMLRRMTTRLGLIPEWRYHAGTNELVIKAPGAGIREEILMVVAGILAILFGTVGSVLPEGFRSGLLTYLLNPASDAFINALNTFVGIMIFVSVVSGICSIGSAADFSKMGRFVIVRQLLDTFLYAGIGLIMLVPFFHLKWGVTAGGASQVGMIVETLFSVIPSNPVTPFAEGNILQIIFMAVMSGTALLVLEERTGKIRDLVIQTMDLFQEIIAVVCRLLPFYIFTSLAVFIVENGLGVFVRLWRPILLVVVINVLFVAVKVLFMALRLRVPAGLLLKKVREPSLTALFTASSTAAYGQMINSLDKKLGVSPSFYRFALPFVNLLAGNTCAVSIIVILLYLTEMQSMAMSLPWLITLWFMSAVFSMAMPPVSGGFLVCIGAIMMQLGINDSGLALAGILGIIFDFVSTWSKIEIQLMDIALQAQHFKKLDRDILTK